MRMLLSPRWRLAIGAALLSVVAPIHDVFAADGGPLGLFTAQADVGKPSTVGAGSVDYEAGEGVYTVLGGGANMWAGADHFHFVYKKISGDVAIEATLRFVDSKPDPAAHDAHRKACLMIRQSLDSDAVYADVAVHGNGLAALQWRDAKGAITQEVHSKVVGPNRLRLEKRGNTVSMSIAAAGEELHAADGTANIELTGDFYIGLAVCAHNGARLEKAAFSNVKISLPDAAAGRIAPK